MKVFFTASFNGKKSYQKYYNLIVDVLEQCNVELVSPEKGNYLDILSQKEKNRIGETKLIHYEAIRRGIHWADTVIIEISQEDFQLGHEATLAIQAKKPLLCLSLHEDFSKKIRHRFFHGAIYTEFTIDNLIEVFLKQCEKNLYKQRFNCFLSSSQLEFLQKTARSFGMNKSEYIRKLIEDDRSLA